jgi:hypothetical protein
MTRPLNGRQRAALIVFAVVTPFLAPFLLAWEGLREFAGGVRYAVFLAWAAVKYDAVGGWREYRRLIGLLREG